MNYELLLSGTKWDIVSSLAKQPKSPLELATELGTSVANISMQMRLLEMAQIVSKKKIENSKAGKPRVNYYLTQSVFFVHGASPQVQMRQAISFDSQKELILNIWQTPLEIQNVLIKCLYEHPQLFSSTVFYADYNKQTITLLFSQDAPSPLQKSYKIELNQTTFTIECKQVSDLTKFPSAIALRRGSK